MRERERKERECRLSGHGKDCDSSSEVNGIIWENGLGVVPGLRTDSRVGAVDSLLKLVTVVWDKAVDVLTVDMLTLARFWMDFKGRVIITIGITNFVISSAVVIALLCPCSLFIILMKSKEAKQFPYGRRLIGSRLGVQSFSSRFKAMFSKPLHHCVRFPLYLAQFLVHNRYLIFS